MQPKYTPSDPTPQALDAPQAACALCGHVPRPYDAKVSTLLDILSLMVAVAHDAKAAAEEVAQ